MCREYTFLAPGDSFTLGKASTAYRLIYTHASGSKQRPVDEDAGARCLTAWHISDSQGQIVALY